VQQLLGQGAADDTDAAEAAAYLAALNGQLSVMRLLLQHGAVAQHRGGPAPLHAAALRWHKEAVQLLLDSGAQPGCKAEDGITALHAGAACSAVRLLLSDVLAAFVGSWLRFFVRQAGCGH
jgi:hypothetical protein